MGAPTLTYTLTNGTTADASQVMQDLNDLLNGITDGSKDLSISGLTVGGNLVANGNTTIGNFSTDTFTMNASLASSIPVLTNATYDVGAAGFGLASLFLGNGTKTTRLMTAASGANYTLTLPSAVGSTAGQHLRTSDGSGGTSFGFPDKTITTKTANYTTTADEVTIPCDATSGAFTVTLIAASGMAGKKYTIKKIDSSANAVTVDGNGAETIDGVATYKLSSQYSTVTIVCDGSNWIIASVSSPPTIQTFTSGSGTYNTPPGAKYLKVRMVGAGGGGAGSGTGSSGGSGGNGGDTTFGSSFLTASGGTGAAGGNSGAVNGGGATIGAPAYGTALSGGKGGGNANFAAGVAMAIGAGFGGSSAFGGNGASGGTSAGSAGQTNTGGGGAGGSFNSNSAGSGNGGAGGGAGGFVDAIVPNPSATYAYAVGAAGTAGSAGTSGTGGAAGGSGYIEVTEYY